MVFLWFSLVSLWYSYGHPLVRLWFSHGFPKYSDGIPTIFFHGFPRCSHHIPMVCRRPRGPRWLTEALCRLTERPRGSPWLTEALRRLTEAWRTCTAAVMWILGLSGGRCRGVPLSRCAGVPVMAVVYQYTGVPMLPLISLWFPFSCPICLLELSYNFLQLPYGCLRFPAGFPIGFPLIS